jgi:hypothetical protein
MNALNLHSGGELVTLAELERVMPPPATHSHNPVPYVELVRMVKYALGYYQHDVVEEQHAIDKQGGRYFGVLTLRSPYGDYTDLCGLRSSYDKSFPVAISVGASVFVCSNLSFFGDFTVRRKNTTYVMRDLPGLVAEIIQPLHERRQAQSRTFQTYKARPMLEPEVHDAIMRMYRAGAVNAQRIPHVLDAFDNPPFDWGDRNAWRLFNAATFALKGKVAEDPSLTRRVHEVIDGYCHEV